ncbi:MAG: S8 family serine peptidase [Nitrospirae bacterium]|nr:S8 family serine peptidase [Nitrospirota bacterium]
MRKLLWTFLILTMSLALACGRDGQMSQSSEGSNSGTVQKAGSVKSYTGTITRGSNISNANSTETKAGSYQEGEVLVKFKTGTPAAKSAAIHKSIGARESVRYNVVDNLVLVKLPEGMSVPDGVASYSQNPDVQYAEPNYLVKGLDVFPNDPFFTNQYALYNNGTYKNGTAGADIKAYKAWDVSAGSRAVIVAVLDTGADYNHPDLGPNIWVGRGWNFVGTEHQNPTASNDPMDTEGHGTHVSGTIGAVGNNNIGVAGVNWLVTIMPVKVLNSDLATTVAAVISGIQYAVTNGAKVMNMSFGWKTQSQSIYDALSSARTSGILVVAAAGNGGSTDGIYCNGSLQNDNDLSPCYPASYNLDNIISVAASDQKDMLASFSNYGVVSVDVAAPGVDICSTISGYSGGTLYDCNYSGTSMASPHVAGLAALLWSYYTNFTYSQIRQMILTYVDLLPSPYNTMISTGGRINAWRAMSSLWAPSNLQVTNNTAGSVTITWQDRATDETFYDVYRKSGSGDYAIYTTLPANSQTMMDAATVAGTSYTYKLKVRNTIGSSPDSTEVPVLAAAPTPTPTPSQSSGGGGGGCSIARTGSNDHTSMPVRADVAVMLIPVAVLIVMRKRKRR